MAASLGDRSCASCRPGDCDAPADELRPAGCAWRVSSLAVTAAVLAAQRAGPTATAQVMSAVD
jgi:hypothetical protein